MMHEGQPFTKLGGGEETAKALFVVLQGNYGY
jgi:hypothetical protein